MTLIEYYSCAERALLWIPNLQLACPHDIFQANNVFVSSVTMPFRFYPSPLLTGSSEGGQDHQDSARFGRDDGSACEPHVALNAVLFWLFLCPLVVTHVQIAVLLSRSCFVCFCIWPAFSVHSCTNTRGVTW